MRTKIKWIDRDVAYVVKDTLYINRHLKKYPKLLKKVIAHEKKHLKSSKVVDVKEDFQDSFKFTFDKDLLKFHLEHPSSLSVALPIWVTKKSIMINWFLLGSYFLAAICIYFIVTLII